ncbi:hypothetical protein HK103_002186 [Boothiomyces macroporosus]|uniref:SH3 domain-containing protein n=1 Tax=Boothiomyces macroporosus TaxID=261099 RepID=A0AAD5Y4W8_9FUNG|nr:hypothetical protein HK103_002186 [Boothiomyces macroporosus]
MGVKADSSTCGLGSLKSEYCSKFPSESCCKKYYSLQQVQPPMYVYFIIAGVFVFLLLLLVFTTQSKKKDEGEKHQLLSKYIVTREHEEHEDELELRYGEIIVVDKIYSDQWADALNESTGKRGKVMMSKLTILD